MGNFFQDKQCCLLSESLATSWSEHRPFISATDVAVFDRIDRPAIVPDALLKLGAEFPTDLEHKSGRSYYVWLYGAPDLVIEIVSGQAGGEDSTKLERYREIRVPLRIFQTTGGSYLERIDRIFPELGGDYDGMSAAWLR